MLSLYILLIITVLMYSSWLKTRYQKIDQYLASFPGPRAWPVLGSALELGFKPEGHLKTIRCWIKRNNFAPIRVYFGFIPYVIISNAKNMESVLSSTTMLHKSDVYTLMQPWLGRGLLTANGQYWAGHRKMITPSFHFQILRDFLQTMNSTTERFMQLLNGFAQSGQMFDFQEVVTRSTLDIICECAMAHSPNSVDCKESALVEAINDICTVIQGRLTSVLKRSNVIFSLTADFRKQKKSLEILHRELFEIIETRRKFLEHHKYTKLGTSEDKRPKMAFLDNLLTAHIDGEPLTLQEIFEEVSTFIFEGHDTTASAISFIVYCLSRHPQEQQKAFDEQFQIFGSDLSRQPTYQELVDMKYLELVIKEALRIFPSVPFILRTTTTMTELDGHLIPPDVSIVLSIIGVGTNEHNFEEPYKFRPERFAAINREQTQAFDYVPFSGGSRNCIGQKFAMMEMKCTISKMLRHFVILPAVEGLPEGIHDPTDERDVYTNPYDARLIFRLTLKSVNGIYVRLQKRLNL